MENIIRIIFLQAEMAGGIAILYLFKAILIVVVILASLIILAKTVDKFIIGDKKKKPDYNT